MAFKTDIISDESIDYFLRIMMHKFGVLLYDDTYEVNVTIVEKVKKIWQLGKVAQA